MIVDNGKYYLYRHVRLDKNVPFYIGIGGKEADKGEYYYRAKRTSNRNKIWNDVYKGCMGNICVDIVLESNSWAFIKEKEKEFISLYGRKNNNTGILANMTDGGDGSVGAIYTQERRKKQSDAIKNSPNNLKGKKLPKSWVDKIRNAKIGKLNPCYGKTPKHIAKKVIDTETGIVYNSIMDAAKSTPYQFQYVSAMLKGDKKNKTTLKYYNG